MWPNIFARRIGGTQGRGLAGATCVRSREQRLVRRLATLIGLFALLAGLLPGGGRANTSDACPGAGAPPPTPVDVAVTAIPAVVDSTAADYFVLYVQPTPDSSREVPISVVRGQEVSTTLTDRLAPLAPERYRVEKYSVADPADIDGDCADDISELADPAGLNPLNPAPQIPADDGVLAIPDRSTFVRLAYQEPQDTPDPRLRGLEYVKFTLVGPRTANPILYFQNTQKHRGHLAFRFATGYYLEEMLRRLADEPVMYGQIIYHPMVNAPDGSLGVYRIDLEAAWGFEDVAIAYEILAANLGMITDNLAYVPMPRIQAPGLFDGQSNVQFPEAQYRQEQAQYDASRVRVLLQRDLHGEVEFVALNRAVGVGFLRVLEPGERPHPRDIVILETLPNELSRVAGIITTVMQTPLAHVNLRAVQDGVPNAFVSDALGRADIDDLIESWVRYTVDGSGYTIQAATPAEADAFHAASVPQRVQTPERDLTRTQITDLDEIGFNDWKAFGVKAANLAVLRTLGFPNGTVPDGFAVPFYFYDEFMKHNGFYEDVRRMLADPLFQSDYDIQEDMLKDLRKQIKKGESPAWMITALEAMHATFPEGRSLRYRSSTNNEDLPGFSGAGLYDSKTQHADETVNDGIDKSLRQVFASLWNFRAFTEREFHRIDHFAAAMGVLVHPNYSGELANGVAVSFDPISGSHQSYYVNTQLGEDLVTNPEALSTPEEILFDLSGGYSVLARSNRVTNGRLLMSDAQMTQLREHLESIHDHFKALYDPSPLQEFAMEIEFKITVDDVLAIKQARPWVFHGYDNTEASGAPTIVGTAEVDQTLTAETSAIVDGDGLDHASFRYQWLRVGGNGESEIEGATDDNYTVSLDDEHHAIRVRVSFSDDRGYRESLTSDPTAHVPRRPNIAATGQPLIVGTAQVGHLLSVDTSGIADLDGLDRVEFRYQWTSNGKDIARATRAAYRVSRYQSGKKLGVRLTFTDDRGHDENSTGEPTAAVVNQANNPAGGAPVIVGSGELGETLTVDLSGVIDQDGRDDAVFRYRWIRVEGETETPIALAIKSTYTPVIEDRDKQVKVRVSFVDDTGYDEQLVSDVISVTATEIHDRAHGLEADYEDGSIRLSWRDPNTHQRSGYYHILRRRPGLGETEPQVIAGFVALSEPVYLDTDVEPDVSYEYSVRAVKDFFGQLGPASDPLRVRIDASGDFLFHEGADTVWSAQMTVALDSGFLGFSFFANMMGRDGGSLSEDEFNLDGVSYQVYLILCDAQRLYVRPNSELPDDLVLWLGARFFKIADATDSVEGPGVIDWPQDTLNWSVGETVVVSLSRAGGTTVGESTITPVTTPLEAVAGGAVAESTDLFDAAGAAAQSGKTTSVLTASVQDQPANHDGSSAFTFELRFSENVKLSYQILRDHAFEIGGGEVSKARRLSQGSNAAWEITVQPSGDADVTIGLPATTDCTVTGAICTSEGRMLSNLLKLTIVGPNSLLVPVKLGEGSGLSR